MGKRVDWIARLGLALVASWYGLNCLAQEPAAARPPNFVVVFADDLGYGDLGCYGHPTIRTPQLDRMANEGLRFTQFYSAAPVCTPARSALLTGRYPVRSGMYGPRRVLFPDSPGGLQPADMTLATVLKQHGYRTACIGKWHLGHLPQYLPTSHGFDQYFGIPYSNDMGADTAGGRLRRWPKLPLLRDAEIVEEEPDQRLLTERYTEASIAFIRSAANEGKPFFLYLPHTMPHVPLFASEKFAGQSPRGLYGDVVETIDWSMGEILQTLRELGLAENTLVFFTSDNGPWLEMRDSGGTAGLLRGGKGSTWEGGMREPAIAWWPSRVPAGKVTTELASTLDLWPTCLALAQIAPPADYVQDGIDISATLLRGEASPRDVLLFYRDDNLMAIRKGPWKLHFMTQAGYGQREPETHDPPLLFHLDHDPGEQHNVAAQHADVVTDLLKSAETARGHVQAAPSQL